MPYATAIDALLYMSSNDANRDQLGYRMSDSKNHSSNFRAEAFVTQNNDGYFIEVSMPGVSRSDISVYTENKMLHVVGVRTLEGGNTKGSENTRRYVRSWSIDENVDVSSVTARYDAGVVRINVPIRKPTKRTIEVE